MVGIEGADGLIALEQAVAQGSDLDIIINRPDGQILLIAVIRRPHAVFNGRDLRLIDRFLRHAGGNGVVDPDRAVRALILQHRRIGVAVFKGAVPGQIQVGDIGIRKRVRRNVDRLIEVKHQVIQRSFRKGARADVLQLAAQVQFLAPGALKRFLADGSDGGGQGQDVGMVVHKRPRADFLQALAPVDPVDLRVHERVVPDLPEAGGEANIGQVARVLKRPRPDALQALGEEDDIHRVVARKGAFADGLHRHAADALGDLHVGVVFRVAGDRAGLGVKGKPVPLVLLFARRGVFAAGLQVSRRVERVGQRLRVGLQLVVGHVDHIVVAQPVKAPVDIQEDRACALEGDLLQVFTGAERAVNDPHAGRNGQAGQRVAVREVGADILQTVVERHAGQAVHPRDDPALDGAQRVGHGQGSDFIV